MTPFYEDFDAELRAEREEAERLARVKSPRELRQIRDRFAVQATRFAFGDARRRRT